MRWNKKFLWVGILKLRNDLIHKLRNDLIDKLRINKIYSFHGCS